MATPVPADAVSTSGRGDTVTRKVSQLVDGHGVDQPGVEVPHCQTVALGCTRLHAVVPAVTAEKQPGLALALPSARGRPGQQADAVTRRNFAATTPQLCRN
jgi:hypothetical protein